MNIKEFLKPNLRKIIITLVIFSIIPVIPNIVHCMCEPGSHCDCPYTEYISLLSIGILGLQDSQFSPYIILGIVFAYLISSIAISLFDKISPETKKAFKEKLKPSKGKIIIFILGCLSILVAFYLYNTATIFETISMTILLPFTFISMYLYQFDIILFSLFGELTKLPIYTYLTGGYGITIGGGLREASLMLPSLIIEWYLISCLFVYVYHKVKKK